MVNNFDTDFISMVYHHGNIDSRSAPHSQKVNWTHISPRNGQKPYQTYTLQTKCVNLATPMGNFDTLFTIPSYSTKYDFLTALTSRSIAAQLNCSLQSKYTRTSYLFSLQSQILRLRQTVPRLFELLFFTKFTSALSRRTSEKSGKHCIQKHFRVNSFSYTLNLGEADAGVVGEFNPAQMDYRTKPRTNSGKR